MDELEPDDDAELVVRARAGDMEALGALYDRHASAVFAFLRGMLDTHSAEDVLQDTFIAAAERLDTYVEQGAFRSWLYCLARTRALDRLRRHKRFRDKHEELRHMPPPSPAVTPDQEVASGEIAGRILDAVRELAPMQQSVFLMREQGEMAFQEIAAALKIPLNTALSHMHRALVNLRARLTDLDKPQTATRPSPQRPPSAKRRS